MRIDDSLDTVLNADRSTPFGVQTTWRQLVDLIGRGRATADEATIARLEALRPDVPPPVRAASARALAFARPPAELVQFFADDAFNIAAPVLRTAALSADEWLSLLPALNPSTRSILRHRRDLPDAITVALDSFGPVDFVLPRPDGEQPIAEAPVADTPAAIEQPAEERVAVAEPVPAAAPIPLHSKPERADGAYPIADLVARIDAFQRQRATGDAAPTAGRVLDGLRFETDARGTVRAVEGLARESLVGLSLAHAGAQGIVHVDPAISIAVLRRGRIDGGMLRISGGSAAGEWLLSGIPAFDADGRFQGHVVAARRDHGAANDQGRAGGDALRQLVHELRTPANAIAGFAEMIDAQLLGPVPGGYREHARTVLGEANRLIATIDDLDTAARLESGALSLGEDRVALGQIVVRQLDGHSDATIGPGVAALTSAGDRRATEQLVARLGEALTHALSEGETLAVSGSVAIGAAELHFTRPAAFELPKGDALLVEDEAGSGAGLGTAFKFRLARRLAESMGGRLAVSSDGLTLRLPTGDNGSMEQPAFRA